MSNQDKLLALVAELRRAPSEGRSAALLDEMQAIIEVVHCPYTALRLLDNYRAGTIDRNNFCHYITDFAMRNMLH